MTPARRVKRVFAWLTYWGAIVNRVTGWRLSRLNRWVYAVTGGRLGDSVHGADLILLTTTGRRTGRQTIVPVVAWRDGDDLIVGAHAGASPVDPQWLRNIRVNGDALVQMKREIFNVRASVLDDDEREHLVARIASDSPLVALHERRSRRRAPMVRLQRVTARDAG